MSEIGDRIKEFILNEFLPDEDPSELMNTTPLLASGILDSLATLKLVSFLEESYGIKVQPYETDEDNFASIADVEKLVESKL